MKVVTQDDRDHYTDLASNILSSILAYQFGLRSVAHVRKTYVDGTGIPIGDAWIALARDAHKSI